MKSSARMRPYSSVVLDGLSRAPSRAMLYPVGYKESDFSKPQIGVEMDALRDALKRVRKLRAEIVALASDMRS